MDIYQEPCHDRCKGLIILETYTTLKKEELKLPSFLDIEREVTDSKDFSMYTLSKKEETTEEMKERLRKSSTEPALSSIPNGHA